MEKSADEDPQLKRRRPRNDQNSRDFICFCGKAYLSYPALYTHMKNKHEGNPSGEIIRPKNQLNDKTARGRPKNVQNTQQQQTNIEELNDPDPEFLDESIEALSIIETLTLYICQNFKFSNLQDDSEHTSDQLKNIFPKEQIFNDPEDYQAIYQRFCFIIDNKGYKDQNLIDGIYNTNCNTIFANFLYAISKHLQLHIIREIAIFLCFYRKALNQRGCHEQEYCEFNNGKDLLDISNDLITTLIPIYLAEIKKQEDLKILLQQPNNQHIIKLTQFFCAWLYNKHYTNSKLQLKQNEDENEDDQSENDQ